MRKLFCLILAIVMVISLCACVSNSDLEAVNGELKASQDQLAEYKEYDTLIRYLKSENYEAAIADIESRMPEPTEPEFTEIKITMDNYLDYFTVDFTEDWKVNAFGEIDGLDVNYILRMKADYTSRLRNIENTTINVEWTEEGHVYNCDVDFKNKTYTLAAEPNYIYPASKRAESFAGSFFVSDTFLGAALAKGNLSGDTIWMPGNFEILRIQGSIFLSNE